MFTIKKYTVLAKGEVHGDYRQYLLADEHGKAFNVYRCNCGNWPQFNRGDEVGIMVLGDRMAWDTAGFDASRVSEMPMPTAANLAEIAELRSQSNNVCFA